MIHKVFAIYDAGAQAYLPPFILPRAEMAQRTFGDCVNSKDHQFGAHPEDYTLFCLGLWDDETAIYTMEGNGPQTLGNGVEYVRKDGLNGQGGPQENGETTAGPTEVGDDSPIQPGSPGSDTQE